MSTNTSFNPTYPHDLRLLPPTTAFNKEKILTMLIEARAELGELKGFSFSMPNPLLLLSPAIIKESLASSEIEDINTTMIDVLENQLFPEIEQKAPDKEVLRYRDAILWGFENLSTYSLSTKLITGMQHKLVSTNTIGYRQAQNGIENSVTKELLYTPPVAANIPNLMSNLENFMNNKDGTLDPLIRSIISHYQFEAIHPFSDGNGRTGRMLMVLQLVELGVLNNPILYISGYINKHKNKYYRLLLETTTRNNWQEYVEFMLRGFTLQAKETKEFLFKIMELYFSYKKIMKKDFKNIYSADLVEALFSYPVITATKLSNILGLHRETVSKYLRKLVQGGLLLDKRVGKYHFYINKQLLDILHG